MTETLKKPRHKWTKEEIAHLNRVVGHAKTKKHGFELIADEMGIPMGTVASQYGNLHRKGKTPSFKPKAAIAPSKVQQAKSNPVQQGRPFDFSKASESELLEVLQAITGEVDRRAKSLMQIGELLK